MNQRFTFAGLLTSPIPAEQNIDRKINYATHYYNPYQIHQPQPWSTDSIASIPPQYLPAMYTQPLSPPTPQPQAAQPPPQSSPQTMTRTRGRRVSNIPSQGTRMFACNNDGCGKIFKRSEHLKRHVRSIHTMEKPFKCPYQSCNKRFSRSDNLNQHIRIHRHTKSSFASPSISNSSSTTTTHSSSSSLSSPQQYTY